jgi:hypothetical protein
MAFVADNDVLVSVLLKGGYGIGKQGLQVSLDNEERARKVAGDLRPLAPEDDPSTPPDPTSDDSS